MNDRFKFRFWNKTRKIMETFNNSPLTLGGLLLGKNDNYEILSCTGLKDKNSKLIYEGDIVTYDDSDIYPHHTPILNAVIEMRKYQWCMVYFRKDIINADTREPAEQKTWLGFDDFITSRIEVIGNIYENSELLEECE